MKPEPTYFVEVRSVRYTFNDIFKVVEAFYREVARDPLLMKPFSSVEDWPHHVERLTHFWWTRFGGRSYQEGSYDPVGKHFEAGFNEIFLQRWLSLFRETLHTNISPAQAELWAAISESMGQALSKNNKMMEERFGKVT